MTPEVYAVTRERARQLVVGALSSLRMAEEIGR